MSLAVIGHWYVVKPIKESHADFCPIVDKQARKSTCICMQPVGVRFEFSQRNFTIHMSLQYCNHGYILLSPMSADELVGAWTSLGDIFIGDHRDAVDRLATVEATGCSICYTPSHDFPVVIIYSRWTVRL